ncbi:hypothetical protein [Bartonella sp. MU37NMGALS]|uniref:hypothetical protein n=1 Tax=Bartonella sp. MU37NMGALS TaxID=3243560 RepID=UPI0035D08BA4
MEKKYELTDETIEVGRKTLCRIRALRDLGDIKQGDLGGYIEKEDNLSHHGNCWIGGYAKVYDDAKVYENAQVYGDAHIYGHAKIYGEACVCWNDWIDDDRRISTRKQTR